MATRKAAAAHAVSPNNPCPFLRALVSEGLLADDVESLAHVGQTIAEVARTGDGQPALPATAVGLVAMFGNGLWPWQTLHSLLSGVRLNELRDGPLDKRGVGSGILDARAHVVKAELERLDSFATDLADPAAGGSERGLAIRQLRAFMDANFERAKGRRRVVDRKLMDGEWPVLLKVMGKGKGARRYLSMTELRTLFVQRQLPRRMRDQLPA